MTQKVILAETGTAKAETVRVLNLIREEPFKKRESGILLSLFFVGYCSSVEGNRERLIRRDCGFKWCKVACSGFTYRVPLQSESNRLLFAWYEAKVSRRKYRLFQAIERRGTSAHSSRTQEMPFTKRGQALALIKHKPSPPLTTEKAVRAVQCSLFSWSSFQRHSGVNRRGYRRVGVSPIDMNRFCGVLIYPPYYYGYWLLMSFSVEK